MASLGNLFFKIGADVREATSAINKVESQIRKASSTFGSLGKTFFAGLSAAGLLEIGKKAIQASNEYEKAFLKIKNLTDSATKDIEIYQRSLGKIATTAGVPIQELADGLFDITSAGLTGAKALEALEIAAKGAALGMGSTQEIAKSITGVLNAYSSTNLTAARAAEILFNTTKQGAIDINELTTTLANVTPLAAALGVNLEQVGAFLATVSLNGTKASEGVTQLASILNAVINPSTEAKKILDSMGISMVQLQQVIKTDLREGLLILEKGFNGNTEAMAKFFGRKEAVIGFLSAVGQNAEKYGQILQGNIDVTNNFEKASEEALSTLESRWKKFTVNIGILLKALGDTSKQILVGATSYSDYSDEAGNVAKISEEIRRRTSLTTEQIGKQLSYLKQFRQYNSSVQQGSGPLAPIAGVQEQKSNLDSIFDQVNKIFDTLDKKGKKSLFDQEKMAADDLALKRTQENLDIISRQLDKIEEGLQLPKFEQNLFKQEKIVEVQAIPNGVGQVERLIGDAQDRLKEKIQQTQKTYDEFGQRALEVNDGFTQGINGITTQYFTFGDILTGIKDDLINIGEVAGQAFNQLGAALVDGSSGFKVLALAALDAARAIVNAALAEAIALAIAGSLKNSFNVIAGLALAAVAVGVVTALFKSKIPKLAKGGLAYGPQLAVVGDNPNASRDPEVISPLSKLHELIKGEMYQLASNMANAMDLALRTASVTVPDVNPNAIQANGPQEIIVKGEIDGSVIRLSYDRSASTHSKFQPRYY